MLSYFLLASALIFSVVVNGYIKNWIYDNIVRQELEQAETEEEIYDNSTVIYTTFAMVLLNNLIPLTLGAAIGLYAIS